MNTYSAVIYTSLWFILPLIPAFIIFKLLPSTTIVRGPFKGLNIDLSGAFASYFLLFIISMPIMKKLINKEDLYEVWNVKGKVIDGQTSLPIDLSQNPHLVVQPPDKVHNTGDFSFKIIAERKGESSIVFPIVEIEADGYLPQSLGSLDYKLGKDTKRTFCDEVDCSERKALYKTIKLDRKPNISPTQINFVEDAN
jgi:hypothetical protein